MEFLAGNEKRFFDFISNLNEKDKIAMLAHNDGDGICSAVITSKVVGKIDFIQFLDYSPNVLGSLIDELKSKKINKVIILDFVVENQLEGLKEIEKFAEILIIDHHLFTQDLNSNKITFIKTRSTYPSSYECYYLFSKIQEIPGWIVALGVLSDMSIKYKPETCQNVYDEYEIKGEKLNLWNEVIDLGFALIYFRKNLKKVYELLLNSKNLEDLKQLKEYSDLVKKEFDFYLEDYKKNSEKFEDLAFYYFEPKFGISSMLVNEISRNDFNTTFVFVTRKDEKTLGISARRQDGKVDCVKLLQESVKEIPESNAGGHKPAAGGRIPKKYLEKFKKNLFKVYESMKKGS